METFVLQVLCRTLGNVAHCCLHTVFLVRCLISKEDR